MLTLLDHSLPADVLPFLHGPGLLHHPELSAGRHGARAAALASHRPDVLLTRTMLDPSETAAWYEATDADAPLLVVLIDADDEHAREESGQATPGAGCPRLTVHRLKDPHGTERAVYARALALAERLWLTAVTAPALAARLSAVRPFRGSVALVGAGVVNLITALRLVRAGHAVTVYDRAPDPRADAHWTVYGTSRGGGDGRMFTLTETDGYHGNPQTGPIPYLRPLVDNGWCLAEPSALRQEELDWVHDSTRIPPWLARAYTDDVLLFNQFARRSWEELFTAEPTLSRDVGLRDGILRLYNDPVRLSAQTARQWALGAVRTVLSPAEVAKRHPALTGAHTAGALAGGVEVVGFTVQIHDFLARLTGLLEEEGAVFHWETPVEGLRTDPNGLPDGLRCQEEVVRFDHYVLSPGAYGGELLRGTATHGLIHGVIGVWLTLPNLAPQLMNSVKISRSGHLAEDSNVTVTTGPDGEPLLVVGSGYGWTGADPAHIDPIQLEALHMAVEDTAAWFFPEAYEEARRTGLLKESRRHCVRPWTASSLPVLEIAPNAHGGLVVVTGGHNTGGFAQAPVAADAVAAALRGEPHPTHIRYHPDRLRMFYRQR
ncbi:NAD(P)/FAD-dependent oxidoreductase [Streptomyces sp. NBC_00690]|uniref:NAD(P)/FAD-dependent oxidoreductase n=1 Tax=Streptomyces sp. NBC_00690 TaxID=2975808 RepID=UPI002E2CBAAA|nr:FAD-dependent oxidoreductase [Streptomyces sp. NBC_00690]